MATALKLETRTCSTGESGLERGFVRSCHNGFFQVVSENDAAFSCQAAASCLLRPQNGDQVLVHAGEPAYIIAVLDRSGQLEASVELPERTRIHSRDCLTLESGGQLDLTTVRLNVTADHGHGLVRHLDVVGECLISSWQQAQQTVLEFQTHCRSWTQRLVNCFRHIRELDETQAQDVRIVAEESINTHAQVVNQTAADLFRIDGGEVHLG